MSGAASVIRLRRRRKPPARLVFLAIDYALRVALVTFWMVVAITVREWRPEGSGLAVVWTTLAVWTSQDFARTLAAWRRGEPCRPVSHIEWGILGCQLLGVLVILLGLVP